MARRNQLKQELKMAFAHPMKIIFVLALGVGCNAPAQGQSGAAPSGLKVVELFTSQGCSSCPPANANLASLANRRDVLALSFGVDYWDYLGWKDTFASPDYTQRQRDYARGMALRNVYTPQMVVNGSRDLVGNRMTDVERALSLAAPLTAGPSLSVSSGRVTLGTRPALARAATVWHVAYDPAAVQVPIRRGENGGKTLPHVNVVRRLSKLGEFNGQPITLSLPTATNPALRSAILVQSGVGGPILSAIKF
jgi:hypothetical protein